MAWSTFVAAAAAVPMLVVVLAPAAAAPDRLSAHRWKDRVLLVLAPDAADARLASQRDIFRQMGTEARDRDLKLVEVLGDTAEAAALQRRFGLGPGFHALLIGKDGGAKLTAEAPLQPAALVPLIDAMPMRREEMRQSR